LEETQYHVQLVGRTVGPYDRRTIVGMRIKKALSSADVLIDGGGARLTVADLIGKRPGSGFNPSRSGSYSLVQATYTAALMNFKSGGADIPSFRGEMEVRVQSDCLRLAGRFRQRFGWKEDRAKIPLKDIVHTRLRGSLVDLWLRAGQESKLHRMTLELFSPESAGGFIAWLPAATPYPGKEGDSGSALRNPAALLAAAVGAVLAVGIVLMAVLMHR
jgi:hypothetical protein